MTIQVPLRAMPSLRGLVIQNGIALVLWGLWVTIVAQGTQGNAIAHYASNAPYHTTWVSTQSLGVLALAHD